MPDPPMWEPEIQRMILFINTFDYRNFEKLLVSQLAKKMSPINESEEGSLLN
jgi:hypothetical protein